MLDDCDDILLFWSNVRAERKAFQAEQIHRVAQQDLVYTLDVSITYLDSIQNDLPKSMQPKELFQHKIQHDAHICIGRMYRINPVEKHPSERFANLPGINSVVALLRGYPAVCLGELGDAGTTEKVRQQMGLLWIRLPCEVDA